MVSRDMWAVILAAFTGGEKARIVKNVFPALRPHATFWLPVFATFAALTCTPAIAQRANDNALAAAEDAFGTTVGNETIGLYDARNARGFNPQASGNVRIEGMYFDRPQSGPGDVMVDRLTSGFTVRVGLTAQAYPFPAPSGIVDINLRIPRRDSALASMVATFGPYDTYGLEIDGQTPIVPGKLNVAAGIKGQRLRSDFDSTANDWSASTLARWTPSENIEVVPFWGRYERHDFEANPFIYGFGDINPPLIKRGVNYQQGWSDFEQHETNFGVLTRFRLGDNWTLRTGTFRAFYLRAKDTLTFYQNVMPSGLSDLSFQRSPEQEFSSWSGEVRASGVYVVDDFRHTFHITARGRDGKRLTGGTAIVRVGTAILGVPTPVPEPVFNFSPRISDFASQITGGALYDLQWRRVGGFSIGLQKASYKRNVQVPNGPPSALSARPWLYNSTWSLQPIQQMTVFGSYTKGLEESGVASQAARNRGEAMPSSITRQIDAGISYALSANMKVVTTVFEIKKPDFDRDATTLFTNVGNLSHQGVEFSLTGQPAPALTMSAGVVLLKARVKGPLVDQGVIGSVPVGRDSSAMRLDLQYGPSAWKGLSVDGQLERLDKGFANSHNLANIPPRVVVNLGARYRFKILDEASTLRVRLQNLTNTFAWEYTGGNNYYLQYIGARRVTVSLAADF